MEAAPEKLVTIVHANSELEKYQPVGRVADSQNGYGGSDPCQGERSGNDLRNDPESGLHDSVIGTRDMRRNYVLRHNSYCRVV